MRYFLRMGADYLDQVTAHRTKGAAVAAYADCARDLARFEQTIAAAIHLAPDAESVVEYPDFVLSLGPRGGVKCERT